MPRTPVIVVGLDCIQGLQSARVFARRGVPVVGVAKDPHYYACRTNACDRILVTDTGGPALADLLEQIGPTFEDRPVLLPCQDKNVLVLSRERERLQRWYRLALPAPAIVETMSDKAAFYTYALEHGFAIPETVVLRSEDDARVAAERLDHPSILKPAYRLRTWSQHTKLKALVVRDGEELIARYRECRGWADVLIAQRQVPGPDSNHFTCNCYFDRGGVPAVTFTSRKLRQWRPQTGQACLSQEAHNELVEQETLRLFDSVDYRGLGYLEMKRDARSGDYLIIEPNIGRPTGRAALAEGSGVELLYTVYCDLTGRPLPEARKQEFRGVKWIHLLRDLQAAAHHYRRGQLSLRDWWRSVRGPKVFAIASWRDPKPFLAALWHALPAAGSARERAPALD